MIALYRMRKMRQLIISYS